MRVRLFGIAVGLAAVGLTAVPAPAAPTPDVSGTARSVDRLIAEGNAGKTLRDAPVVDDLAFLRRLSIDLIGRIPTDAEIQKYLAYPAAERRAKAIDDLVGRDQFADRWAIFLGDMLRVRSGADGGAALQAYIHEAIRSNVPYDQLARRLIAASGKAGAQPETAFILGDEADPYAMTGVVAQVFMGTRISCAQCHNHPFDKWTREEFYDLAAYFGQTRKAESRIKMRLIGVYLQETGQNMIQWPPEDKAKGKTRTPVQPKFPFELTEGDTPTKAIARLTALRAKQDAEAKAKAANTAGSVDTLLDSVDTKNGGKKPEAFDVAGEARTAANSLDVQGDIYRASALRRKLAEQVTDPRNRLFSKSFVNRVWGELLGTGFVNPVDDFRDDNEVHHPKTLDLLADEFIAGGFDFRTLVKTVVSTQAYQRGRLPATVPATERLAAEQAFTATRVRRMVSETLFDSIVSAGHLFDVKHKPGENVVTVTNYVQVPIEVKDDPKTPKAKPETAMVAKAMPGGGYDLERGIEVDFKSALMKKDDLKVEAMSAKSNEELEAEMMMRNGTMRKPGVRVRYTTKEVKALVDDNPRFVSSMKIASPAPVGHFLRVFGQTDRGSLDERRDHSPSMRQALMMLNGKLSNEAARVGSLEPMHKLLVGDKADLDAAIKLAYREALTREPTADETAEAKAIIAGAAAPVDGMADLRWALFNSHEFRYIP